MKKEIKILIILFVLAFIIRSIFLFSTPLRIWDETVYANLGYDLSKNPLDYSVANNGWSDFIPSGGDNNYAWPNMGFRAPLLPYFLSLFYLFKLNFLVEFFMVFIGALSVCLVYLLGKEIFNEKIALYSSILFLVIPLHIIFSSKILTDVLVTFFILLSFLSFWKGYEKRNNKHKILFGVFLALAILSRYTALWIIPVFLLYFLIRNKSLKFLKDKYLWYSILIFLLILIPWLIYSEFTYGSFIGAFIHGAKASLYWGGVQPWNLYFNSWWQMFSLTGFIFILAILYILYKKEFRKKEIYLLLIWILIFLAIAIYTPRKEGRFILPIVPVIVLISGYFIDKIKKYKRIILILVVCICIFSLYSQFSKDYINSYTETSECFIKANEFLQNQENSLIVTDESPIIYYYTKAETFFYPNPWNYSSLNEIIKNSYSNKESFVFFTDFDMPSWNSRGIEIKKDLDKNLEKVFECYKEESYSIIYKF